MRYLNITLLTICRSYRRIFKHQKLFLARWNLLPKAVGGNHPFCGYQKLPVTPVSFFPCKFIPVLCRRFMIYFFKCFAKIVGVGKTHLICDF
jgi:hypothetical protein